MSLEHGSQTGRSPEGITNKGGITILYPGLAGTIDSNTGMLDTLKRVVGVSAGEAFILHPSDASTDFQFRRDTREVDELKDALRKGKDIRLVAHSMGAVTLAQIIERTQLESPELFTKDALNRVQIVLIAPAGFIKPGQDSVTLLKRVQEFSSTQPNVKVDAVALQSDFVTFGRFIDSLASFPLEADIQHDFDELIDQIHPPASSVNGKHEHIHVERFSPKQGYRQPDLPKDISLKKTAIDELLVKIFKRDIPSSASPFEVQKALIQLIQKRNEILSPYVIKAYDGTPPITPPQTDFQKKVTFLANILCSVPTFVDMLTGKPLRMVELLQDKAQITFIIPDRDLLVPLSDYEQMGYLDNVRVLMRGYTHASWVTGGSQVEGGNMERALRVALSPSGRKVSSG